MEQKERESDNIELRSEKVRDSNPRYHVMGIPDFESSAFGHSANLPFVSAKLIIKNVNGAYGCFN